MTRWAAGLSAAAVLALSVLMTGCGVPLEADAQRLPADAVPPVAAGTAQPSPSATSATPDDATSTPSSTATSTADAAVPVRLWFVGDDGLEAVPVLVPATATAETLLQLLAAGPTGSAAGRGLRTVVPDPTGAGALVVAPETAPGGSPAPAATGVDVQTVRVSEAFAALPPAEQVLVLGQVVLTLTDAGAEAVQITDAAGTPLAVPLPDGRLLDRPATAQDYRPLIAKP